VLSLFIVTCRLGIYEISRMNGVSQVINMAVAKTLGHCNRMNMGV
jgi:hypothetical protein